MCGLTGLFRPGQTLPVDQAERLVIRRMNDAIAHRGPDEDGFFFGPGIALAARRLSIIDVAGSHQPQSGPSGQTVCVFNGEIYNFRALRDELAALGHRFQTHGDTEVLPHGYEEWGIEGLLRRLVGMFAFAIWDGRTRDLFIARDRLGIKPMYFAPMGSTIYFGSELKSILSHPDVARDVDPDSLARYLVLEYVPSPRSIYRGIEKLPPGCYARVHADGRLERIPYWTLRWGLGREDWPYPEFPLPAAGDDTESAWIPPLLHALRESVRARLVSEVPIGALLSGGIDSSAVSALMAELLPDLRTFSIEFEEESFDESRWSRQVAAHIGSRHTARTFPADEFRGVLDRVRGFLDEPFADASILPTWLLSRTVRDEGVTVVLSGDGADELFAGYPTYLAQSVAAPLAALPGAGRALDVVSRLAAFLPSSYENVSPDYKLKRFLAGAALPPVRRHATWLGAFLEEEMRSVLAPPLRDSLAQGTPWSELESIAGGAEGASDAERLLHLDLRTYMGDDILVKVDRASMACSLEVRVPFLDHRFVEMVARIPYDLKLRGGTGKYLLKRAIAPRLPRGIAARGKKGFGIPVAKWLRGPWRELASDLLGPASPGLDASFEPGVVRALLDEHLSGRRDRRKPLWTLMIYRLWEQGPWGPAARPAPP